MKTLRYNLLLQPEPEGGYTVLVPALPGCVSFGNTVKEAKKMALDAIGGYIASLKKHGESIPSDEESVIAYVEVPTPTGIHA